MDTAKLTIENGIGVASLYTISDICYKVCCVLFNYLFGVHIMYT